jgi:hypothetical protein
MQRNSVYANDSDYVSACEPPAPCRRRRIFTCLHLHCALYAGRCFPPRYALLTPFY